MSNPIRKGDTVAVLNCTATGRFIVEGFAVVIKVKRDGKRFAECVVQFHDQPSETFDRQIDKVAQGDPVAYAEQLNQEREQAL